MNEVFRAFDILESRLLPKFGFSYVEPEIKAKNGDVPAFREAVTTTERIFRMIKQYDLLMMRYPRERKEDNGHDHVARKNT